MVELPHPPPSMEDKIPVGWRFFKVMVPGFQTKLALPQVVCEKLKGNQPLEATLITAKGKWNVGIRHGKRGKLYLEKGWDAFVQNHGLLVQELAVFEYKGGVCFDVSLLDKNGSEKAVSDIIDQETIDSSEAEMIGLVAVKLKKDEDMITSQINSRLAPLLAILAEIDNDDLPCHGNVNDRCPSVENAPEHDDDNNNKNNKCRIELERNKEGESSRLNSSLAPSVEEIGHEKALSSEVKTQERADKVSAKSEVDEDAVAPSQIKHHQNPKKVRSSLKQRRGDERVPSLPMKIQKHETNRCSTERKKDDDDIAPSQAEIQKHDKDKPSVVKHDENNSSVEQRNLKDRVPSQLKDSAQHKKEDTKRKREPKVNKSSPEQCLQFSKLVKQYHIRRRSPYMTLPAAFCVANGLYQNARITLKGPTNEHQVSLKVCKGGKTIYAILTRGWPEFIKGNNLKEGDTCVFKMHSRGSDSDAAVVLGVEVVSAETNLG